MSISSWLRRRWSRHRIGVPTTWVESLCQEHGIDGWHLYALRERSCMPHLGWICDHLVRNRFHDRRIHEVGCGLGWNLHELARRGFAHLEGSDLEAKHIEVARLIADRYQPRLSFRIGDGLSPGPFGHRTDAILAFGWLFLVENLDLGAWLQRCCAVLAAHGRICFDTIDPAWRETHPHHSADALLPELQRRPSEYRNAYSADTVEAICRDIGLRRWNGSAPLGSPAKIVHVVGRADEP